MRRFITCFVAACAVAVLAAGTAPGKNGQGVTCVLHAKLAAKNETTGSTSTAKGRTQIKVRNDGTIGLDSDLEPRPRDIRRGPYPSGTSRRRRPNCGALHPIAHGVDKRSPHKQSGVATPNAGTTGATIYKNPSAYYVTTTQRRSRAARFAASSGSHHSREGGRRRLAPRDAKAARTAGTVWIFPRKVLQRVGEEDRWPGRSSASSRIPFPSLGDDWVAGPAFSPPAQVSAEPRIYLTRGKTGTRCGAARAAWRRRPAPSGYPQT